MVISKSLPVIMAAFILVPSCARMELKREMKRFMASEIVLPAEMEKSQGGAIVPVHREELSGPKMVVFIDSTECTSCRLSKLMVYDSVERLSEESGNFRLVVLISAKKGEEAKVRNPSPIRRFHSRCIWIRGWSFADITPLSLTTAVSTVSSLTVPAARY